MKEWFGVAAIWTIFFGSVGLASLELPEPYNFQCFGIFTGLYILFGFMAKDLYNPPQAGE